MAKTRSIELDIETADEIEARAARRGVTARELVAELLAPEPDLPDAQALADLEAQWAAIERGDVATVPHDKVARWLDTWGTPAFKPWARQ